MKQNHKCNVCNRQFVRDNTHTIPQSKKDVIKGLLKERISLRAMCRASKVSMNWLLKYARSLWERTPKSIGICSDRSQKVRKLQVFGFQMDEMWSFVANKLKKRWLWLCYDPVCRLVIAGGRGRAGCEGILGLKFPCPRFLSCPDRPLGGLQEYNSKRTT